MSLCCHSAKNTLCILKYSQYVLTGWQLLADPSWPLDLPCVLLLVAPLGGGTDGWGWRLNIEPGEPETAEQTEPCG